VKLLQLLFLFKNSLVISIVVEIIYIFIFYGFLGNKLQVLAVEKPHIMKLVTDVKCLYKQSFNFSFLLLIDKRKKKMISFDPFSASNLVDAVYFLFLR
jgi:hypothetical protein